MGCDIHAYLEFRRSERTGWSPFGKLRLGRCYAAFARMAGVRNYSECKPVSQPRGMPGDAAWMAKCDNRLYVTENCESGEPSCTPQQAERWVSEGTSQWANADKDFVTNPDWHSHSWLTPSEFEAAIAGLPDTAEYQAALAAMRSFEPTHRARIVFWFDN